MLYSEIVPGMKVRFREWDDMVEEFGCTLSGNINVDYQFTDSMRYLCGAEFEVEEVVNHSMVTLVDHPENPHTDRRWLISADMLEPALATAQADIDLVDLFRVLQA